MAESACGASTNQLLLKSLTLRKAFPICTTGRDMRQSSINWVQEINFVLNCKVIFKDISDSWRYAPNFQLVLKCYD